MPTQRFHDVYAAQKNPDGYSYQDALGAATAQLRRNLEAFTYVFPADPTAENVCLSRARDDG